MYAVRKADCDFSVLIVAKCIVNKKFTNVIDRGRVVLIVAKCIVNENRKVEYDYSLNVLIVAKCIVNSQKLYRIFFL